MERPVAFDLCPELLEIEIIPYQLAGTRITGIDTGSANDTTLTVNWFIRCDRLLETGFNAGATGDAVIGVQHDLILDSLAFGVMTPGTAQWAAFEEDGRADAGAVIDRVMFDIK